MENLPIISDKDFTSKLFGLLKNGSISGVQGLSGLFAMERKDMILTAGRLLQGVINWEFLDTLHREWDRLRKDSQIRDDYQKTEQHHACLQQMLDFLDSDKPDKIRFEFMKKIFLSAATEKGQNTDSILPQQYMFISRQLTSGDILLL